MPELQLLRQITTMKIVGYSCMLLVALAMYACSTGGAAEVFDNKNQKPSPTSVDNTHKVPLSVYASMTRAEDNQWVAYDSIGIVLYDVNTNILSDGRTNYHYFTDPSQLGSFTPISVDETAYYPQNGGNVDILAYYPFNPNVGDDLLIPMCTSDQSNIPAIDYMVADKLLDRNADNPSVTLDFRHKMAKIIVKLSKDTTNAAIVDLTTAKITYKGGPMRAVWSMAMQDFYSKEAPEDLVLPYDPQTLTASALVIPSSPGDTLLFRIEAKGWEGQVNPYEARLAADDILAPGTVNNINIKIDQTRVKVSVHVTDWNTKEIISGNGEADYE